MDWIGVGDARAFLGLKDDDDLEGIVLEHEIDVELDEDDNVVVLDATQLPEVLFERHRVQVGHRPDDPLAVKRSWAAHEGAETKRRNKAKADRERLRARRKA